VFVTEKTGFPLFWITPGEAGHGYNYANNDVWKAAFAWWNKQHSDGLD